MASVRESVAALRESRPAQPLSVQLRTLAIESTAAGLPTSVDVQGAERRLDSDVQVALYRAAQEGLTNIHKHANARTSVLRLVYQTSSVRLEVRDDGRGLGRDRGGFGLVGLRERVDRLGGSLAVESTPGRGVAVRVEVPG